MWTTDRELRVTAAYGALSSRDVRDVVGQHVADVFQSESHSPSLATSHRRALAGHTSQCLFRWRHRSYVGNIEPYPFSSPSRTGCVGVGQPADHLLPNRKEMEQLFEESPQLMCVAGTDGFFKSINPAFEKVLGYSRQELLSRRFDEFIHPEDRKDTLEEVGHLACGMPTRGFENRFRCKDGSYRWLAWTAMLEPEDGHIHATATDVTRQKEAEKALRKHEVSLHAAQAIQQQLLPKSPPPAEGFDIAGALIPAEYAAGDGFDFIRLDNEKLLLVVSDVTGHGIGPGLLMASTQTLVRLLAQATDDVCEILSRANNFLAHRTEEDRFVTMALALLDMNCRVLSYAGAGHPNGYVFDSGGNIKRQLETTMIPLGIFHDTKGPVAKQVELDPGDCIVLLTDGVLEARNGEQECFGVDRVVHCYGKARNLAATAIVDEILKSVRSFSEGERLQDDVTTVVAKIV